jgi:hypothetical protein
MITARYISDGKTVGYVPVYTQEEMNEIMTTKKQKEEFEKRSAAAKKAAATRARNKALRDNTTPWEYTEPHTVAGDTDNVYYVVMQRGFLSAKALTLFSTREAAQEAAAALETTSSAPYNKYVVNRVELTA